MHTINFFSESYQKDPYFYYKHMHKEQPLFFHEPTQSYVLSRFEDVERALKDPVFSSRNYAWQVEPLHGVTFIQLDGKEHSRQRNFVAPALRGKELMEQSTTIIQDIATRLLNKLKGKSQADLRMEFTNIFALKVVMSLLGLPDEDTSLFYKWYNSFAVYFEDLSGNPEILQEALRDRDQFHIYLSRIIDERTDDPQHGSDILSTLCNTIVDGKRMDKLEIMGFCGVLMQAGAETTDKGLASLFRNLLMHPDQFTQLLQDRSLIDRAITESLRYTPPLSMILRVTNEKVQVSGGEIPANATVTCLLAAANRDETQFKDPDKFNIFREELDTKTTFTAARNMATFGFGRHFCIGAQLAKLEMQVAVEAILNDLQDMQFATDDIPTEIGLFTRYPENLKIKFKPFE
ncbi:cytochrome P450 [Chitinophaga nivalis]|uniref:Cytochrome P450 n=1 Tax=Chitinophaga nivalis TaxID=2991709 RepID=A0ABT3IN33_9BACT|nr:cytochrome P450 [Chitinophaga nivalis]MCW3464919.1 cytochrome P450 [Chitinophaga nivalis]MCW3485389.1 cytochrome P450 [Chitinophaga nivalis]